MSTTKTKTDRTPRFTGIDSVGVEFLLPSGASCVPSEIETLNADAIRAHDRLDLVQRQFFAVREEAKKAPALDRAADAAATAAGQPLPTTRVTGEAQRALDLAERAFEAAQANYSDAQILLAREIARRHGAWVSEARDSLDEQRRELREQLDRLAHGLDALARDEQVLDGLLRFPIRGGSLIGVRFGRAAGRDEAAAEHRRQRAREKVRKIDQIGGPSSMQVARDPDSLLAAIGSLIDGPEARTTTRVSARGIK